MKIKLGIFATIGILAILINCASAQIVLAQFGSMVPSGANATSAAYGNIETAGPGASGTGAVAHVTSPTLITPVLGTPTSGDLTNTVNFPVSQLLGAGTGIRTFLATPSSANLSAAMTDETGSGALVFGTGPTLSDATLDGTTTFASSTAQLDSSGRLALGATVQNFGGIGTPGLSNSGTSFASAQTFFGRFDNTAGAPLITLAKSRGATIGSYVSVNNNDSLGRILFAGTDTSGTSFFSSADIAAFVAATPSAGIVPGRLVFKTADSGGTLQEAMSIRSNQDVRIGSGSALATTATGGFLIFSASAGAPTGTPTNAGAGAVPVEFNTTAKTPHYYSGAWYAGLSETTGGTINLAYTSGNGAAAAVGTLGNAPVAGNPTKWVPINDNGTTRYIPAW